MTSYKDLEREISRQQARLAFTTDPQSARILQSSIDDLLRMLPKFPQGLLWCAAQPPEAN